MIQKKNKQLEPKEVKLCGFLCFYNELSRGNIQRYVDNLNQYCDYLVAYDDASTDGTHKYICENFQGKLIIIPGDKNEFTNEMQHKQSLLNIIESHLPDTTHILFLDADEILDAQGTREIRDIAHNMPEDVGGVSLGIVQLWRSNCWERIDKWYGDGQSFVRLWRFKKDLKMDDGEGLHKQHFPLNLGKVIPHHGVKVIHYGYSRKEFILGRYRSRPSVPRDVRGVALDESTLKLRKYSLDNFPQHARPSQPDAQPEPITYTEEERGE